MSHPRILGAAALAAAATMITVMPSADAATPTVPAFSGSTYAAKLPNLSSPVAADGFQCKNLPQLPQLPQLPSLSDLLKLLPHAPQSNIDIPPVTAGGDLDLAGFGTLSDMSTDTKLIKQADGSDGVASTNSIGDITLKGGPLGTLDIAGLDVSATATATDPSATDPSATGNAVIGVGDITLTKPDGTVQKFTIPGVSNSTTVPGFAKISLGGTTSEDGVHAASASAQGLVITMLQTGEQFVIGGASALANDGDIPGLAQAGELDPSNIIDLLCNTDPATVFQKLAALPSDALTAAGISIAKTGTGTYTGSIGDAGSLSLGTSGVALDQGLGHLKLSTTPDGQLNITGDLHTDGPLTLSGTGLGKLLGIDGKSFNLPSIASLTATGGTAGLGAGLNQLTLTALDDNAKLVQVDGSDLTLTQDN